MSSNTASSHCWQVVLAARWELSRAVNQKPLLSSIWVSLRGCLGFAEHNGRGPIRNAPRCRVLKAQPRKCSVPRVGPRFSKHRLSLLRGVEMSHLKKKKYNGKGHSVVGHLSKYSPPPSGRASLTFSLGFCNRILAFLCPPPMNLWILEWTCQVPSKNILNGILSEVSDTTDSISVYWVPTMR